VIGALRLARSDRSAAAAVYFLSMPCHDALGNPKVPRWWVLLDIGGNFDFNLWIRPTERSSATRSLERDVPFGLTVGASSGYPHALDAPTS